MEAETGVKVEIRGTEEQINQPNVAPSLVQGLPMRNDTRKSMET